MPIKTAAIQPIPKSTFYSNILPVLGIATVFAAGTFFSDNGDGTCTPCSNPIQGPQTPLSADRFGIDGLFFTPFNTASPVPVLLQVFWSFDNLGNIIQVANDGSQEATTLIKNGLFFFSQASAQAALANLSQQPK